ncbi:hypothetical protein [Nocardiopsis potens]|uniref:hypothetical protein n=1 Tax=Nocardiopsis potens TaxID=1246458 RepID=UPI00034913E7|nr:hypothetical protein [Nocardiopsis potens]
MLGNALPHLHGHVHARYRWEPGGLHTGPVWLHGPERSADRHRAGPAHGGLRRDLAAAITGITAQAY